MKFSFSWACFWCTLFAFASKFIVQNSPYHSHTHTSIKFKAPHAPPSSDIICTSHAAPVANMFHLGARHAENREHKNKKSQEEKKKRRTRRRRRWWQWRIILWRWRGRGGGGEGRGRRRRTQRGKQMQTPTCRTVRSSEARLVSLESIYDRTCNPTDPQTRKESEGNRVKWQIYSGLNEVIIDHNSIEFNSQGQWRGINSRGDRTSRLRLKTPNSNSSQPWPLYSF